MISRSTLAADVKARLADLAQAVERATGLGAPPAELAEGFLRIAVETMANAVKRISIQRGYDVAEPHPLVCFGGSRLASTPAASLMRSRHAAG